jgi:hypothetical protein
MFRRRRYEEPPGLKEFLQQTAHLMNPSPQEHARLINEAVPDPAPPVPAREAVEDFPPPDLRPPARKPAGEMMTFPWPLEIDGTVRACPVCEVDRDWLILCVGSDIWLRCRSGHETREPALNNAWFHQICGPVEELHQSKNEGVTKMGFDGTFSGIIFPSE